MIEHLILIIALMLAAYLFFQIKLKKRNGKTLTQELDILSKNVEVKTTEEAELKTKLKKQQEEFKHLIELEENESSLTKSVEDLRSKVKNNKHEMNILKTEKIELSDSIINLKNDISIYQPTIDLINIGFIEEPKYLYETSIRFKEEIKIIRNQQKALITAKEAILIPETIALTNNKAYVNKVLSGQTKLMLKALNIECDNLMLTVKSSNYAKVLERIEKAAADLEKSAVSLKCGFNKKYIELKFKECELQYQYKLKVEREKEEQAAIKELMREEQKAIREFERALEKANKAEKMFQDAIELARIELNTSNENDKSKLNEKIKLLELELQEAIEKSKRVQSMAEQTKRGHVYIISNIGSFGEDVYKIGLTRRLDPMDRVKELGDASVPFRFDVHAMIYSEDAPALETQLHREFTNFKVNQVNHRKEFFRINLLDIKEKAISITENNIDFKMTALAEDYYETLKINKALVQID